MMQWREPLWMRTRRWLLGAAAGSTLHVGALLAAFYQPPVLPFDDDASGPIAIELAPLPVAAQSDQPDAAIGQPSEASVATPATPDTTEVAKAEEAPVLPTTPYEPEDPELKFSKIEPEKDVKETPKDEQTQDPAPQPPAASSAAAPESSAPPPSTATAAQQAAAPQAGMDNIDVQTLQRWQRKVVVHLNKFKRYPADARKGRIEGDVTLAFSVDASGRIVTSQITAPSGDANLDRAALETLERAGTLPPPPAGLSSRAIDLSLPIQYRLKD